MYIKQSLKNFYYGHQIYSSLRQATGALLPALIVGGLLNQMAIGVPMTVGAFALAMIDQYGGQKSVRIKEFIIACFLSALVALVSGFSSGDMPTLFLAVALICFCSAMLNVFGPRWGLVALTGLFVMILNVRTPTYGSAVVHNALYTFLGAAFYLIYTLCVRHFVYLNEERRTVFHSLRDTATYVGKRAALYDPNVALDQAYRAVFTARANLTAQFQTACDVLLSDFPKRRNHDLSEHQRLQYILLKAMSITDTLIATQTDYVALRQHLGKSRFLRLCKQALDNASDDLNILTDRVIHPHKRLRLSNNSEILGAMSAEIRRYKLLEPTQKDPVIRALMLQIVRRIRHIHFLVCHIERSSAHATKSVELAQFIKSSPSSGISPQKPFQWQLLKSNLTLKSPTFRYAIRLSIAGLVGLLVPLGLAHIFSDKLLYSAYTERSYWVLLTLVLIIKPGFALTKQRNKRRMIGTLLGSAVAFLLFQLHPDNAVLFILMWVFYVLALCFLPINYLYGATYVTIFIMIAFYFLHEAGTFVIAERLIDTATGCTLAFILSYLLPNWESTSIKNVAQQAVTSSANLVTATLDPAVDKAAWQKASTNTENDLNNLNAAFQSMLNEPRSHHQYVATYNRMMVQLFILEAQIAVLRSTLNKQGALPELVQHYLQITLDRLQGKADSQPLPEAPPTTPIAAVAPAIQQIASAAAIIRDCIAEIRSDSSCRPAAHAAPTS